LGIDHMAEQPESSNYPVGRIVMMGTLIAGGALTIFGLLWIGLGAVGAAPLARLALSVCVPPTLMAVVIGVIYLARTPGGAA
jgi:hypothetical protein